VVGSDDDEEEAVKEKEKNMWKVNGVVIATQQNKGGKGKRVGITTTWYWWRNGCEQIRLEPP
jgi:hypothetical protein